MAEPDDTLALLAPNGMMKRFTFRPNVPSHNIARGDVWVSRVPTPAMLKVPYDLALPYDGRLELTLAVYPVGVQGSGTAVATAAGDLFGAVSVASKGRMTMGGYLWGSLACYYRETVVRNLHGSWVCCVLSYGPEGVL